MILPEHRNKIPCGLWLSLPRCLQIWDILKAKQKQKVVDRRILKHMLCMIHFFNKRAKTSFKLPLSAEEKGAIESEVCCLLREHKLVQAIIEEGTAEHLSRPYVTPELTMEDVSLTWHTKNPVEFYKDYLAYKRKGTDSDPHLRSCAFFRNVSRIYKDDSHI